jgi:hypothetical protein
VTHPKDICENFEPKLPDFKEFFYEIIVFRQQVLVGYQNIAGFLNFSTFLSDL